MKHFAPIALSCLVANCNVLLANQAIAGTYSDILTRCQYIQNGNVQIDNTCTQSGATWAGGGAMNLRWEDGVSTLILFGQQTDGQNPCPNPRTPHVSVDGICGALFQRKVEAGDGWVDLICATVKDGAVCWFAKQR